MGCKILLVDDSADLLSAYEILLKTSTPHEVRTAASGRTALEIVRAWRPDLVVTDIIMPDMSGLDLISRIRSDLPPPLPVIAAWSGFPEFEAEARRRGAQVFQPKPLYPEDFVPFIESLLGERKPPERLRTDALARRHAASQLAQVQLSKTLCRRPYFQQAATLTARLVARYFEDADVGLLVMEAGQMRVFAASDNSGAWTRLGSVLGYAVSIVESGSTLILPDLSAIPASDSRAPAPNAQQLVAVPLRMEGVTIGALALVDRRAVSFDAHDLAILEHIGDKYAAVLADEPFAPVPGEPGVLPNESWRYFLRHEMEHVHSGRSVVVTLASLPPVCNEATPIATPEALESMERAVDHLIEWLPPRTALGRLTPGTLAVFGLAEDRAKVEQTLQHMLLSLASQPGDVCTAMLTVSGLHPGDGGVAILEVAQWLLAAAMTRGPGTTLQARVIPEVVAAGGPLTASVNATA